MSLFTILCIAFSLYNLFHIYKNFKIIRHKIRKISRCNRYLATLKLIMTFQNLGIRVDEEKYENLVLRYRMEDILDGAGFND